MSHVKQDATAFVVNELVVDVCQVECALNWQTERIVGRLPFDNGVVRVLRVVSKVELSISCAYRRRDQIQTLANDCIAGTLDLIFNNHITLK